MSATDDSRMARVFEGETYAKLLSGFGDALAAMEKVNPRPGPYPDHMRLAMIGFSQVCFLSNWDVSETQFIASYLESDSSLRARETFGEAAESILSFCSLAYGVLLGKWAVGRITDEDFSLAEIQLGVFYIQHQDEIIDIYGKHLKRPAT
jgi:hypothetical protein